MLINKSKINYIVDILMLICFLVSAISGVFLLFSPKGPRAGWYKVIEGGRRGDLNDLHIIFGILMIVFGLIHFILHWNWIVVVTKSFFKREKEER